MKKGVCIQVKISTITYYIKDAFKSLKRNRTISIASIITVIITFFVLGIFSLVASNINNIVQDVKNKVDVRVVLKEDIKLIDQREIEVKLREVEGVTEVKYKSKEEEFNDLKESTHGNEGLLSGYTLQNNPYTGSFVVKLQSPEYAQNVTDAVEDMSGVDKIDSQQETIDKIVNVVSGIRIIGFGLFAILIGVSIFLIMNTTKLTVYSRRREVGIMKFVGATDWFIRWPFVIEGMVIGFLGATLSCLLLFAAYSGMYSWIASHLMIVNLVSTGFIFSSLLWKFIIGGIFIGGCASALSLRKFLIV